MRGLLFLQMPEVWSKKVATDLTSRQIGFPKDHARGLSGTNSQIHQRWL
jgi:hypothetical protein